MGPKVLLKNKASLYTCAVLIAAWVVNAHNVYRTISANDIRPSYIEQDVFVGTNNTLQERLNPQNYKTETDKTHNTYSDLNEWENKNKESLTKPNHGLRKIMVHLDRAFYRTGSARSISWALFILIPSLLGIGCLTLALPLRRQTYLKGEVLWARALLDPTQYSDDAMAKFLRVSACRVNQISSNSGNYRTLEPVSEAVYGKTYLRADGFYALPFLITNLPFDTPLDLTCDISSDFPCNRAIGEKVVSNRRGDDVTLTSANPKAEGIELRLNLFTPK